MVEAEEGMPEQGEDSSEALQMRTLPRDSGRNVSGPRRQETQNQRNPGRPRRSLRPALLMGRMGRLHTTDVRRSGRVPGNMPRLPFGEDEGREFDTEVQ